MRDLVLKLIGENYKLKDILKIVRHQKSEIISYGFITEKYTFEDGTFVSTVWGDDVF